MVSAHDSPTAVEFATKLIMKGLNVNSLFVLHHERECTPLFVALEAGYILSLLLLSSHVLPLLPSSLFLYLSFFVSLTFPPRSLTALSPLLLSLLSSFSSSLLFLSLSTLLLFNIFILSCALTEA